MKYLVALLLLAAPALPAQEEEALLARLLTRGGFMMSKEAKAQSDSAWLAGAKARKEAAMCVASGGFSYGVAMNGKPFVLVVGFTKANIAGTDSTHVYWRGGICGDSLPSWHSHIVDNGARYEPSDCDRHGAAVRRRVPFHIQVGDTNNLRVYLPDPAYADTTRAWCY